MTGKVRELQTLNTKLTRTTSQLTGYSRKLEALLKTINNIQTCHTPAMLKKCLLEAMHSELGFEKCAFLEIDHERMVMRISESYGFEKQINPDLESHHDAPQFLAVFGQQQVAYFESLEEIGYEEARKYF